MRAARISFPRSPAVQISLEPSLPHRERKHNTPTGQGKHSATTRFPGRLGLMGSSRPHTARLAEKLYNIRTHLSLSQSQMVDRLKDQKLPSPLKVYAGNISRFEKGLREPPPLILLAYARTAGVTVEVLIDASLNLPPQIAQSLKVSQKRGATQKAKAGSLSRKLVERKKKKIPSKKLRRGSQED